MLSKTVLLLLLSSVAALSSSSTLSRRAFLASSATISTAWQAQSSPSSAISIPMITTEEFSVILRDSAGSISRVDFAGPKSEQVTVQLVDGSQFGIKDIVDSPTDPRSPLKVSAMCRENGVPTKFVDLEKALSGVTKRKKSYANSRVLEAAEKEKARLTRMEEDEQERLKALYRMEEQEAKQ